MLQRYSADGMYEAEVSHNIVCGFACVGGYSAFEKSVLRGLFLLINVQVVAAFCVWGLKIPALVFMYI